MQGLRTNGGVIALVSFGVLAVVGLALFVMSLFGGQPSIDPIQPTAGGAINPSKRLIVVGTTSAPMRNLRVTVDNDDVTGQVRGAADGITLDMPRLANGPHTMAVSYSTGGGLMGGAASKSWDFTVDRRAPRLTVTRPATDGFNAHTVPLAGVATPHSTIRITWASDGLAGAEAAGTGGAWATSAQLPDGASTLRVTATDRAGNSTTKTKRVYVDTVPPTLQLAATGKLAKLTSTPQPIIYGKVGGENAALLTYGASINGVGVVRIKGSDASGTDGDTGLSLNGNRFALAIGRLPEGKNTITIWVTDRGGNRAKKSFTSFVDTQSQFGVSQLTVGATGQDVRQLQERLAAIHLWKGGLSGNYDEKTVKAVTRYQKRFRLPKTGSVDAATLKKMVGRIDVSLNQRRLTLYRDGRAYATFGIAIGMPGHETPVGSFKVTDMRKNPTWLPPDSPWAKGLGPIPPGPGNPLGTRWIGTSAPAVGIHGTPAAWSIGSAASHGCMRMRISDNEKLYEDVVVGMPVDIHY
jgi:hypothetical protein